MLTDFRYEFYNAGERIDEMMRFSISSSSAGFNAEGNDSQSVGFWHLNAPAESFFTVPAEMTSGNEVVRVNFATDIKQRLGRQGVVLVDPKWDPAVEDPDEELTKYPVAPNRDLARKRGAEIWQLHLETIVKAHLGDCENAMAAGGTPRAARGFTKKCFKMLGVADPGEAYFKGLKHGARPAGNGDASNSVVLEIQRQNQAMMGIMLAIASGQKIDPEMLKALMPAPGAAPAGPVMSGIATGEITKPMGEFDPAKAGLDGKPVEVKHGQVGLDAYDRKAAAKKGRASAAERELVTR